MAMIDWEDKQPAAPMGAGEKVFMAFVVAVTCYGYVGNARFLYNTLVTWLS